MKHMSRKYILLLTGWLLTIASFASVPDKKPEKVLPVQEKVYLHFDNNCYFLGDTIWYKAYVVLADDNSPEPLSRILYVELLNEQGYLMERQQLEINKLGQADGRFAIPATTFAGYYEIRAYTKWMLNFGYELVEPWRMIEGDSVVYLRQQENHTYEVPSKWKSLEDNLARYQKDLFTKDGEYNKPTSIDKDGMHKNYRDYHNLFSRVLPVYSCPDSAHNYMRKIMPTKVTVGDYEVKWKTPEFDVRFYPEGGYMLEGHQCVVAWEAMNQQLERLNVSGVLLEDGVPIDSIRPVHAGRGFFTLIPQRGKNYKVQYTFEDRKFSFKLPDALKEGVSLHVEQDGDGAYFYLEKEFKQPRKLTLNIYCRGKKTGAFPAKEAIAVPIDDLNEGVNQVVVTDSLGNVYADRLFFVNKLYESKAKISVIGIANRPYTPLEKIKLNLLATDAKGRALKFQTFSVSVRDDSQLDPSFATGNIMTNLLLESDLKGFVENPDYYFEADDEKHRLALDVLMLVQGWRRYDWRFIEMPDKYVLDYMPEQKMIIYGEVMPLRTNIVEAITGKEKKKIQVSCAMMNLYEDLEPGQPFKFRAAVEVDSSGHFQVVYDPFYGHYQMSLRAKYVKKIEKKNKIDLMAHDPKLFVRKQYFYPQAVKAYSWYETHINTSYLWKDDAITNYPKNRLTREDYQNEIYASEWIPQVKIQAKSRPHIKLQKDKPVHQIDFLDFVNDLWDQGYYPAFGLLDGKTIYFDRREQVVSIQEDPAALDRENHYKEDSYLYKIVDYARLRYKPSEDNYETFSFSINWNNNDFEERVRTIEYLPILNRIDIVSDAPRRPTPYEHYHLDRISGSKSSKAYDTYVNLITFPDDKTRITVGREYNFQGFTKPVEYYNPDYSKAKLPDIKDYRRTLYWNPNVTTDNFGQASIEFYNNSVCNIIDVTAEGITRYGQFLVNE
jgi:hypothetical protein